MLLNSLHEMGPVEGLSNLLKRRKLENLSPPSGRDFAAGWVRRMN